MVLSVCVVAVQLLRSLITQIFKSVKSIVEITLIQEFEHAIVKSALGEGK